MIMILLKLIITPLLYKFRFTITVPNPEAFPSPYPTFRLFFALESDLGEK